MSKNIRWRGLLVLALFVLAMASLAPTFLPRSLPSWWIQTFDPIRLGLDLQGGMHLVLGVEVDKAVKSRVDAIVDQSEEFMREKDIVFKRVDPEHDRLVITVYDEEAGSRVDALVREQFPVLQPAPTAGEPDGPLRKEYRLDPREVEQIREYALRQALETLRNRVDQFGVSEPTLQMQGDNRILVQLPGIDDPARAIALLGKTARLEFKMVAEDVSMQETVNGTLSSGAERLFERRLDARTGVTSETPILVQAKTVLTGDLLADAQVRLDPRFQEPYVAIKFNPVGAKRFDQITAANVGKRMAIVLDDIVYSAPVIRERISGGSAQISGAFTEQEAADLAIVLRAGSLPAPVKILENRVVGPSLGNDSIQQGMLSVGIGALLVVAAMLIYYRLSGMVANIALVLNIIFIMAMLSLFQATLTLPGIAGIVLTIGMAVDANVLIFERIREELRLGKTARAALNAGFSKALSSIVDSNVTTLIAALVLFQFGTGPVKGFAVTLSIGIACSMFTAIVVSRLIFDYFLERRQIRRLSI